MQLCAVLTRDDLVGLVEEITPLRVELGSRSRRVIFVGRPSRLELVAGAGLRIRGDARFTWDLAGMTIPVTLRAFQILLVPSIVVRRGHHVLAFDPVLEDLDFKRVPMFLDGRIAEAINDALLAQRSKLAWDFTKALGISHELPARLQPAARFELVPSGGNVVVTSDELRLDIAFEAHVLRRAAAEPVAAPRQPAPPRAGGSSPRAAAPSPPSSAARVSEVPIGARAGHAPDAAPPALNVAEASADAPLSASTAGSAPAPAPPPPVVAAPPTAR